MSGTPLTSHESKPPAMAAVANVPGPVGRRRRQLPLSLLGRSLAM
jgi:hypothetical protein